MADQEAIFAKAEELSGYNALALKAMALYAYDHRKKAEAMRICSFVWGRNARLMARAIDLFPAYFADDAASTTDDYLSLFAMASLESAFAWNLEQERHDRTLSAWQIRERVRELKQRPKKETLKDRCTQLVLDWRANPANDLTAWDCADSLEEILYGKV